MMTSSPLSENARPAAPLPRRAHLWVLLLVLACASFFPNLGLAELFDVNEAQRLLPALEMIERGDWVVPRIDGSVYINKPPLVYWVIAASYKLAGGASPLAGRLPIALASLGSVLLAAWIGFRHLPGLSGFWAGGALAATSYFRHKAQMAELDPLLTFALLAGGYAFWRALTEASRRWLGFALLGALFTGIGFLLKGPVVLPFLLAAALAGAVAAPQARRRLPAALAIILTVTALVALPWCVLLIKRLGWSEVWRVLNRESLVRVVKSSQINSGPIYYYLSQIGAAFMPWTLTLALWPVAAFRVFRRQLADPFHRFAAWFVVFSFLLFSLFKGKETEYLLPAFPWLALLAGLALEWLMRRAEAAGRPWRILVALMTLLAGVGALSPLVLVLPGGQWFRASGLIVAMLAAGAPLAACSLYWLHLRRRLRAALALLAALVLLTGAVEDVRKVYRNRTASPTALAARLAQAGLPVYRWKVDRPEIVWHVRAQTGKLPPADHLARAAAPQAIAVLVRDKDLKRLRREYGDVIRIESKPQCEMLHCVLVRAVRKPS